MLSGVGVAASNIPFLIEGEEVVAQHVGKGTVILQILTRISDLQDTQTE